MSDGTDTARTRRRTITAIQVVLIACALVAFGWVISKLVGYWQAQQSYSEIRAAYASEGDSVDFGPLIAKYPNTVAWIRCDDLPRIDYPVMQTDNNDYYLSHDAAGEPSVDGSIFLDYRNNSVTNDMHAIVYGHNMRDGSMFGTLTSFEDEAFFRDSSGSFVICTPTGAYRYQIFAVDIVDPDNDVFMVGFTDQATFGAFVDMLKQSSMYDTGVDVSASDQVVTLSTCSNSDRLVVSGKRVTR